MFSVPSSRQFVLPSIYLTVFIFLLHLYTRPWIRNYLSIDAVITSQFGHGTPIESPTTPSVNHATVSSIFDLHLKPLPNKHITALPECPLKPNNATNAIRIPHPILNISLTPPNSQHDPELQYFNPTLIPLPPHSPYPYLLLSRLVTAGLHQESHICLATMCLPQNTTHPRALPIDAGPCSVSDEQVLGPQGGIRCATEPERLNIPPTPAYQCEGAWAAFPDIPGFHDPRVFWSGKGEPLVIVNSGSSVGCVGLWIVDLRVVYKEVADLLTRKGSYVGGGRGTRRDGGEVKIEEGPVRMSYPYLTELGRSPKGSRGMVEKNWILFFPDGDESWIQYDLVAHGRGEKEQGEGKGAGVQKDHPSKSVQMAIDEKIDLAVKGRTGNITSSEGISNSTPVRAAGGVTFGLDTTTSGSAVDQSTNLSNLIHEHEYLKRTNPFITNHPHPQLNTSRTLAKLIGSGLTTSNLTSPNESPCLSSIDLLDSTGNTGHWHQGSNSLRLILCFRHDIACSKPHDRGGLVKEGKVVHFAILHRKFSNELDLPMRYERYVMVWEARFPFRMVGISRYPILFKGERAQPWSVAENGLEDGKGDQEEEAKRWEGVYFTYTPSLAWGWRKESVMDGDGGSGRTGLGTGYLGDEVVVGVGMDDVAQGFVRLKAEELIGCLRLCPDFEVLAADVLL